jgi:two-component system, NtrC family, sensor histidine kinase PilS
MAGREAPAPSEFRRRIEYLMLFRVGLITIVLSLTVVLRLASPRDLALPGSVTLFGIVVATYALTLVYAAFLSRVQNLVRFADFQLAGDLLITSALVHVTGGAQSGYTFFYPLSIIGAAIVRYRKGAVVIGAASVGLFVLVAILGWTRILPAPLGGATTAPWDQTRWELLRSIMLNVGAMTAVAFLAAKLGEQLSLTGQSLARQSQRVMDLATLKDDIIRSLSSGLITTDLDGIVLTTNEAAGEILEVEPAETIGKPVAELLPGLAKLLSAMGDRDSIRRAELSGQRSSGQNLVLGVSISPLMSGDDEAKGRILNFQDLTELRRMEAQVKRAERLAAIGGLAAGIAHEIRNPLASISGSIELLRAAPHLDGENKDLMEIVLREVDRLNGLVTDLLDYARPRERSPAELELGELLDETVRVFSQDRSAPRLSVSFHGGEPIPLQADPGQVRQVVWNLLRNAAEAMPEGGTIDVSMAARDGWAEITVADSGVGIAPEDREKIFEPFYTTKTRGSGLGLATVQRIVTEHAGELLCDSTVGKGTRFTVRLPRAPVTARA